MSHSCLSSPLTQSCLGSRCVSSNIVLLTQAFRKKFVIPDFEEFTSHVDRIFEDAKELTGGKVRARVLGQVYLASPGFPGAGSPTDKR